MADEEGPDDKVLTVPSTDPRWEAVVDLDQLPEHLLREIAHFFAVYKELEPGKGTETMGWHDAARAARVVEDARRRAGT